MANSFLKSNRILVIAGVIILVGGFLGYKYLQSRKYALPNGIASGNGRVEAKLVDASAKEPLRVKDILVNEGDLVKPGQVLGHLDTVTLESQLAEANAKVAAARQELAVARSQISKRRSDIELARIETDRSNSLLKENAGSQREYDVRRTALASTKAGLSGDEARLQAANEEVAVAEANMATIQTRINDATLVSPVLGRVLYRLAEPGEVLGPGGKALTLVNLEDVYMEIFVPSRQAAAIKSGADARITIDSEPGRAAQGYVSFVSPEAQFTPKEVETKSERDKLMFRVKIQIPKALVTRYIAAIKTGIRGVGYVKLADNATWPSWLQDNLVSANEPAPQQAVPAGTQAK